MACKLRLDSYPNQKARRRLTTMSTAVIAHSRREGRETSHQWGAECLGGEIQDAKRSGGSFVGVREAP